LIEVRGRLKAGDEEAEGKRKGFGSCLRWMKGEELL
jgi:hypothetical protein